MADLNVYARGSVYWYVNPYTNKEDYVKDDTNQDFLTSRPVLIVSEFISTAYDHVQVVPLTSNPQRPGIRIHFSIGNGIYSTILPYNIHYVSVKYLRQYGGQLNRFILNEVYDAMDFHMGRTDKIPEYIKSDPDAMALIEQAANHNGESSPLKQVPIGFETTVGQQPSTSTDDVSNPVSKKRFIIDTRIRNEHESDILFPSGKYNIPIRLNTESKKIFNSINDVDLVQFSGLTANAIAKKFKVSNLLASKLKTLMNDKIQKRKDSLLSFLKMTNNSFGNISKFFTPLDIAIIMNLNKDEMDECKICDSHIKSLLHRQDVS